MEQLLKKWNRYNKQWRTSQLACYFNLWNIVLLLIASHFVVDHHKNYYFESQFGTKIVSDFLWPITFHQKFLDYRVLTNLKCSIWDSFPQFEDLRRAYRTCSNFWGAIPHFWDAVLQFVDLLQFVSVFGIWPNIHTMATNIIGPIIVKRRVSIEKFWIHVKSDGTVVPN